MKIKLSSHAKKRVRERKIKIPDIRKVVVRPDRKLFTQRNRIVSRKRIKQKDLEVIYVIENDRIVIITLYYI